ncbi:MAG: cell division protein FtsA [Patescibacteria group bacterium]|nr:cell division protein FtsA [Patescibacteria group bacterium]
MSNIITGLDIGSSQIRGVVVEQKKDGALSLITAFKNPSTGFRRGVLVDIEEATSVLRDVALDLHKISKRATKNIFVNVNSEYVKARSSRGIVAVSRADQEIHQDDIDRVVQASRAVKLLPNYLILHNIIREYFVDDVGDIADPLGMTGNRLEASTLIVEAFAPQVNLLVKNLERVGFKIGGLIFNPLASSRSVLTKRQKDLGVLMIDFGFGATSMAVYEENKVLHTKSLPVGSGYITNDIAIGFKVSIDAAEKLKVTYGFAVAKDISRREMVKLSEIDPSNKSEVSRRFLAEIIEIRLAEILDLINNELKVLGRSVQLPAGVVIAGGGVKLAGITELIKQELKLPVQIGFPNLQGLEIMNPAHQELLDDPEFASAVGLVRWGSAEEKKSLSGAEVIKNFFKNLVP